MRLAAAGDGRISQHWHDVEHAAPAWPDTQKKCLEAAERARADIAEARRLWDELKAKLDVRHLVFLDETWTKTNMTRLYGRGPRGERVIGRVPHGHWQTTTFLAGLRHDRIVAPLVLDGPIDGATFRAWIEQFLAPTLDVGDIVVADNLGSHKVAGVREAIDARGASMLFLPSYSPDLNPIEQLFAKLKALIRRLAPRSREALFEAIGYAINQVSPAECANYLAHAGYGQSG
jgi:transposase